MGSSAASASIGTWYASAEQVGYAATGAQFEVVRASVYLRTPAQDADAVGQYSHSVQLWSSGLVAVVGVAASTSGTRYTRYAKIYDASSHQLLASNPDGQWCGSSCVPTIGTFPTGDTVVLRLTFFPNTGYLNFLADDRTHHLHADYTTTTGESFTQARLRTECGSDLASRGLGVAILTETMAAGFSARLTAGGHQGHRDHGAARPGLGARREPRPA